MANRDVRPVLVSQNGGGLNVGAHRAVGIPGFVAERPVDQLARNGFVEQPGIG